MDATEANRLIYKIDADMPSILERLILWRLNKFWCFLDLKSMFWSILTDESDCKLQHCVFRFNKDEKLKLYSFVRCVMGMCDSPGLARLVLLKLAEKLKDEFSMAKETVEKRTYMDDIEDVGNNEGKVAKAAIDLIDFFGRGSFKARFCRTTKRSHCDYRREASPIGD